MPLPHQSPSPPSPQMNCLITGAGRGIGRGLSRILLQNGHRVFLVDSNAVELEHTCQKLSQVLRSTTKQQFTSLTADLRSQESLQQIAQEAAAFFDNHLDLLINNAAHTVTSSGASIIGGTNIRERAGYAAHQHGPNTAEHGSGQEGISKEMSDGRDTFAEAWQASLEINLTAPLMLSRACLSMLSKRSKDDGPLSKRQQGGSIIHISSTRAHQSEPDSEPYAATKAGLIGLTHSMAVSLQECGVRVNTVLPGWINVANECMEADKKAGARDDAWPGTPWQESGGMTIEDHKWHPAGRVGRVEDIAKAVIYLAEADFVTGQEIVVDGGVGRKMVYPE